MKAHLLPRFLIFCTAFLFLSTACIAQLSGSYTIPSASYPSLKAIIDSLNLRGISASVTVNFTAATNEVSPVGGYRLGSAALNASLSSTHTLTINGNGNTLTAFVGTSTTADGIFYIMGADYVTINNLMLAESAANTTTTTQMEWGYSLVKLSGTAPFDGCQNDVINGCNISLIKTYTNTVGIRAAHTMAGTATLLTTTGATVASTNSNNVFTANTITNVTRGISLIGINNGAAVYDKNNIIGGSSSALGNNITAGGAANTSYCVYTERDSVVTVRNNVFSIASGQTATYTLYLPSSGVGNLTVTGNTFNMSCALTTTAAIGFTNANTHADPSISNGAGSIHTISNNTVFGTNTSATTGAFTGISVSGAFCQKLVVSNNVVSNVNWGTGTGAMLCFNIINAGIPFLTINNNLVYNVSKTGTTGAISGYVIRNQNSLFGTMVMRDNTVRAVKNNNSIVSYQVVGQTAISLTGLPAGVMSSIHNVVDSIDMSTATAGTLTNNMAMNGQDTSVVSFDSVTNVRMSNTGNTSMITTFGDGTYAPNLYVSKRNYIGNITGGTGSNTIQNNLGQRTTLCDSNTIENISLNGGGQCSTNLGILTNGVVSNNRFNNIVLNNANMNWYLVNSGENPTLRYNAFTNLSITGSGSYSVYGPGLGATGCSAYNNRWDNISVSTGFMQPSQLDVNGGLMSFHDNVMSNISVLNNTSGTIYYYLVQGTAGTVDFYNNYLCNLNFPAAYNTYNSIGLYLVSPLNYRVYNNTIRVSPGIGGGANYGFTGIAYDPSAALDLRNNIINVNIIPTGNGFTAALRRLSGIPGVAPANFGSKSNGNIYYTPNTANSWLYAEGGSVAGLANTFSLANDGGFNTPCGLFKNFIGHDKASFTENNLVTGPLPGSYVPAGLSFAKNGAVPTTSPQVSADLAGASRPQVYDCGPLQFAGSSVDNAPPVITYTPVPVSSYCAAAPTLIANITDATGVNTTPGTAPRLYYKKMTDNNAFGANTSTVSGWKYVEPVSVNGSAFTFVFDYSRLTGPVVPGDSISYFLIAQDMSSGVNTGASIAGFPICPLTVALGSANGPINNVPVSDGFRILNTPVFGIDAYYPAACISGSSTLTLVPDAVGATIQWQSASLTGSFSNIAGATSGSIGTGTLNTTTRYRVLIYCGSTVLTTSLIDTFVVGSPAVLSTTGATHCGYGSLPLSATVAPFSVANWYAASAGGAPIFTGTTFNTPNLSASRTYYVSASTPNANNETVGITAPSPTGTTNGNQWGVEIRFNKASTTFYSTTVYPTGTGTITVDLIDASGNTTWPTKGPFTISGNGLGSPNVLQLNWKNIPPGDYFLELGTAITGTANLNYELPAGFPYVSASGNATVVGGCNAGAVNGWDPYYFFFYNNVISADCETATRVPVTATITAPPPVTLSSPNSPGICTGTSATLNVTSPDSYYGYSWTPGGATTATVTVSPGSTTTYFLTATDPYTGCVNFDSITMAVNNVPAAPLITPKNPSICSGSSVVLNGATPPGGMAIATVGTGTITNSITSYPTPYGQFYGSNHDEYIILASELAAVGIKPNSNITSLAFYQNAAYTGSAMPLFTIQVGNTNQNAASLTLLCAPTLVTVYGPSTETPNGVGWQTYTFAAPFFYTGGNLAVDVATSNCSVCNNTASCTTSFTYNGTVDQSSTPFTSAVSFYEDNNCTVMGCAPSGTLTGTFTQRPNMRFSYQPPVPLNWLNVTGLFKNAGLSAPLTLADTTVNVYAAPAATSVYRAVSNAQGCVSVPSLPDTVFVKPSPDVTITPAGSNTICAGSSVTLCVPTAVNQSYQWFLNNAPIAGANSNCYTATAAGNYTITVTNAVTGCSATSINSNVVVNPVPAIAITPAGPASFCNGGSVVINASSATAVTYAWYRNGIAIPGASGPSYTAYTAATSGVYTAIVSNNLSCSSTSNVVTVTSNVTPTTVTPQGSLSFCSGGSVLLQGPSGTGLGYQWYQNGTAVAGATSQSYNATLAGSYWLQVTSTATGCIDTSAHFTVVPGTPPSSAISPSPAVSVCSGSAATLSALNFPGATYGWRIGGTPIPGATNAVYNASVAGSYTVTVSIAAMPGCSSTTSTPTIVSVIPLPVATAAATGATTVCEGNLVQLNANTGTNLSYQWNLNGNPVATGGNAASYAAAVSGSYTVSVTNTATGCTAISNAVAIIVNPAPTVAIAASGPATFCQGSSVVLNSGLSATAYTLTWNMNGVPVTGATGTSYTANATGLYTVTAINPVTGCQATSPVTSVQVNALPAVVTSPSGALAVCQGTTVTLSSTTVDTNMRYQWQANSVNITGASSTGYNAGTAGTYNLVVTNKITGCSATSPNIVVTVSIPPVATAQAPVKTTICQDDSTVLNANTGTGLSYQWRLNGNNILSAAGSSYYAKLSGNYTVAVTNTASCTTVSNVVAITVNPRPAAYITYSTPLEFCEGSAVVLIANAGLGLTYQWLRNGAPIGNTGSFNVSSTSGLYSLQVTNNFNCASVSDTLNVVVHPIPVPVVSRTGATLQTTTSYSSYQWFFNNGAIGGATAGSYVYLQNGAYKVRVIDVYGCEGESDQFFINNVGVPVTGLANSIKVYPNPTAGVLNVESAVRVRLALRDVTGKALLEAADVKQIDIGSVADGVYLLYIADMEGHLLRVEKVTKTGN